MKLVKTRELSNSEAKAYIRKLQSDVHDLLNNIAADQVNAITTAIEYRDDVIESDIFTDYEVIKRLKVFTSIDIEI